MNALAPVAHIQAEVALYYRLPKRVMTNTDQARSITFPRQVAMLLAFEAGKNKSEIGRRFKRHPSTIKHGIQCIRKLLANGSAVAGDLEILRERLSQ